MNLKKLRKLQDAITDDVIANLHYFDNVGKISSLTSAADVQEAWSGGGARYQSDPIFRAKVLTMVAAIMRSVSDAASNARQQEEK